MNDKIQYNEEGQEHGYWEDYHYNGNIYYKGNYHNGKRIGYWECYWFNGNLMFKGNYDNNGTKIGYWEWYDKCELEEQIFYS